MSENEIPAPGTPEMMAFALASLREFARRDARATLARLNDKDLPRTVVVRHIDWP